MANGWDHPFRAYRFIFMMTSLIICSLFSFNILMNVQRIKVNLQSFNILMNVQRIKVNLQSFNILMNVQRIKVNLQSGMQIFLLGSMSSDKKCLFSDKELPHFR